MPDSLVTDTIKKFSKYFLLSQLFIFNFFFLMFLLLSLNECPSFTESVSMGRETLN